MKIKLATEIIDETTKFGPGLRLALICDHNEEEPESITSEEGFQLDVEYVASFLREHHQTKGLTITGVEPFAQADAILSIIKSAKEQGMNIIVTTNYSKVALLDPQSPHYAINRAILSCVDQLLISPSIKVTADYKEGFQDMNLERIDTQITL